MEYGIKKTEHGCYESLTFSDANVVQTVSESHIHLLGKIEDNDYCKCDTISSGNNITKIGLPNTVNLKLVSKKPFSYTIPNKFYFNKTKVKDFLYSIDYCNIDYDYAYKFFDTVSFKDEGGMCSAVRNGRYYGRNLDWKYDNNVDFVVRTPHVKDRYAVLGVAGNAPSIVADQVDNDKIMYSGFDMFKILPFFLLDE